MKRLHAVRQWTFALAVGVALGFGATQALASPDTASFAEMCTPSGCEETCMREQGLYGLCIRDTATGQLNCECF